jgi:hypothetical protein
MTRISHRRSWACVALWAGGLASIFWAGTRPDSYKLYVMRVSLPHAYPWKGVLAVALIWSLELLAFYAILRPESYRHSSGRAMAATILAASLLVVFGILLIHAPPYLFAHWAWLLACTVGLVVLLDISARRRHAV